jgi:hypothetical protein
LLPMISCVLQALYTPAPFNATGGRNNNNGCFSRFCEIEMKEAPGGGTARYGTSVFEAVHRMVFALTNDRPLRCREQGAGR